MKNMYKFIFPLWIAMAINTLIGIIDSYYLNLYDSAYVSARGLASVPISLIGTLFIGLGIECNRRAASNQPIPLKKIIPLTLTLSSAVTIIAGCYSTLGIAASLMIY